MTGLPTREQLVSLLTEICGDDWCRQDARDTADPTRIPDPSGQIFLSLFDLGEIQRIQDAFCAATGVASVVTTTTGVPITVPSNFCRLCQDVIRKTGRGLENCFHSDAVIGRFNPDGPIIQRCLSGGLWDAGASITAGRAHIANWLIGQVRNESTDTGAMRDYAIAIGADPEEFLAALEDVPVMSQTQFEEISRALYLIANQMSQRAFENLQQAHLIEELGRAERIIGTSPAIAIRWRVLPRWQVEYVSDNVERLFGYTAEEFLNGRTIYPELIHGEDREQVKCELRAAASRDDVQEICHDPYRIVAKHGTVRWVDHITRVLRNMDGEVTGYEGIIIDATGRKEMEAEREQLMTRLERARKMELVGTLAGGVAHDLNNMLGAIVGFPELILEDLPPDSPVRPMVEAIQDAGNRAADVVQDLLTLARRGLSERFPTNVNTVLREFLLSPEHQAIQADHPHMRMSTRLEPDLLNVKGSPTHLSKVFMNLVRNAAEAMPSGGLVTLATENVYVDRELHQYDMIPEGDYVVVTVSDTGVGIEEDDINRIFEPFYSSKGLGTSGSGLGMAVVWGTVKDHGGSITVTSTPGVGTTFRVFLPVTREELGGQGEALPIERYRGHGELILVVDDIAAQRQTARVLLERLGYRVAAVSDGLAAVDYVARHDVDLVVLDMIMAPGIDGLETYGKILEVAPGQKAIITSGFSATAKVRATQKLGAGAYVRKPYTMMKIALAVRDELRAGPR